MAMRILEAREVGSEFVFRIHTDDAKVIPAPEGGGPLPDPDYLLDVGVPKALPAGMTRPQYLAKCRQDIKALAVAELAEVNARRAAVSAPVDLGLAGAAL